MPRARGFTLFELLAVVAIISLLLTLLAPAVMRVRERGRQADCQSNLRQFGTALIVYRADHQGENPPWLSNLYPDYVDDKALFICKSDPWRGGHLWSHNPPSRGEEGDFPEVRDNIHGTHSDRNEDIERNSYFYEFSAALCSWAGNRDTWANVKQVQLRYGFPNFDPNSDRTPIPYSTSRFPIIRCFHHQRNYIAGYGSIDDSTLERSGNRDHPVTFNVAYAGNVFVAPKEWELRLDPGEQD